MAFINRSRDADDANNRRQHLAMTESQRNNVQQPVIAGENGDDGIRLI